MSKFIMPKKHSTSYLEGHSELVKKLTNMTPMIKRMWDDQVELEAMTLVNSLKADSNEVPVDIGLLKGSFDTLEQYSEDGIRAVGTNVEYAEFINRYHSGSAKNPKAGAGYWDRRIEELPKNLVERGEKVLKRVMK